MVLYGFRLRRLGVRCLLCCSCLRFIIGLMVVMLGIMVKVWVDRCVSGWFLSWFVFMVWRCVVNGLC